MAVSPASLLTDATTLRLPRERCSKRTAAPSFVGPAEDGVKFTACLRDRGQTSLKVGSAGR